MTVERDRRPVRTARKYICATGHDTIRYDYLVIRSTFCSVGKTDARSHTTCFIDTIRQRDARYCNVRRQPQALVRTARIEDDVIGIARKALYDRPIGLARTARTPDGPRHLVHAIADDECRPPVAVDLGKARMGVLSAVAQLVPLLSSFPSGET